MNEKNRRLIVLKDLLEKNKLRNQHEILELLDRASQPSTQATLSRDLRELGVLKGPDGYELPRPGQTESREQASQELRRAILGYCRSVRRAGTIVVLRTGPGQAPMLAIEIDRASQRDAVGSVAGDDTIFVATPSPNKAGRLVKFFDAMLKG